MGFNKKIISKSLVDDFNNNPNLYEIFKKYDTFIYESEEVKRKFKQIENEYLEKKVIE